MIERQSNLVTKQVKDVTAETLTKEIIKRVKDGFVYTDEWLGYKSLGKIYDHSFIKHNTR